MDCNWTVCFGATLATTAVLSAMTVAGCTYQYNSYEHGPTHEIMRRIDAELVANLPEYTVEGVVVAPNFRELTDAFRPPRRSSLLLFAPEQDALFVSRVRLETPGGYVVPLPIDQEVAVDKGVYERPYLMGALRLFDDDNVDLARLWSEPSLTLHVWVGGSAESPTERQLTFEIELKSRRDIAWPT